MTQKQTAIEMVAKMYYIKGEDGIYTMTFEMAKKCAIIATQYIINSNPHSNPLNSEVKSTMKFYEGVMKEIKKLKYKA